MHHWFNFLHTYGTGKKTGGRRKGTPNKTTGALRTVISKIVNDYYNSDKFAKDIEDLKPKERVDMMEKLAAYVMPKLQSVDLNANVREERTIEDTLVELAEDDE